MTAVLSACHLLGMLIQLSPPGENAPPWPQFLHLFNGAAVLYVEIYSENDKQEDVMPWAWVFPCLLLFCPLLRSGAGCSSFPVFLSCSPHCGVWVPWYPWRSALSQGPGT